MIRPLLVLAILVLTSCTQDHAGQIEIRQTSCAACHTPEYEATSTPVHVTVGFPMSCADCHRTTEWEGALEGLHPPEPKFPISSGPHGGIPCLDCHDLDIAAPAAAGADTNCVSCHPDSRDQRDSHAGTRGPQGQTYAYTPEVPNFCLVCHPLGRAAKHPDNKFPRSGPHKTSCVSCHDRSAGPDTDGQNTTCLNSGCHSLGQEDRQHDGNRYSTQRGDGSNRHFCLDVSSRADAGVMTSYFALLGLLIAAGVPYILWTRLEARKHQRAAIVHHEVAQLGDEMAPMSLHPEIDLDACIGSGACVRACPEKEILGITDGRARLINPMACVGHSACMQACPVGAIKLVFGTATRGIELPMLSPSFETSCAGVYIIGELTGMGLIRNATMQGQQVAATIAKSGRRGRAGDLDVIVVGAGPAGIAAALGCMAHGRSVQIVEQSVYGGTIAHYPRSKIVMTGTLELPGYGTVRKKTMQKEDLLALWEEIRERVQFDLKEGVRVEAIKRDGDGWRVNGTGGYAERAASVILALGRRGAPRTLGVPGEELPKVVYRLLEPEPFAGKDVMIVGGGNAAADCAIALAEAATCRSVALSYRREQLGRLRGSVRERLTELIREERIKAYLGTEVISITQDKVALKGGTKVEHVHNDHVIVQIGGTSPSELLRTIGIELVEKRGEA